LYAFPKWKDNGISCQLEVHQCILIEPYGLNQLPTNWKRPLWTPSSHGRVRSGTSYHWTGNGISSMAYPRGGAKGHAPNLM